MTSEEFEISYCKGKREAMTCFADWLRDHIKVAKRAIEDGLDSAKVLDRTLESMGEVADRMEGKLSKDPMLISKELVEKDG
jgi:hypothetical protein